MTPDISVAIITYNHALYIERALASVLEQKTDLVVEILVGDDGSTDGTTNIVKRYEEQYPGKIKAFYHDRSQVIYVNDRPTAKYNYLNNLKHAKGKYTAILDGDDYWLSENKLQKQWDYMEQNPSYSTCFHPVKIFDEASKKSLIACPPKRKKHYGAHDLIPDNFIHTSSVMFRSDIYREMPEWFYKVSFGDWAQHLLRADKGPIGYIDDCMSLYRLHGGGRWSGYASTNRVRESIEVLKHFNEYTKGRYQEEILIATERFKYNLVLKLLEADSPKEAKKLFEQLSDLPRSERRIGCLDQLYVWICLRTPIINRFLSKPLKRLRKRF